MTMKNEASIVPRNFTDLIAPTGNVYETTMIIAKRAKQVTLKTKEELNDKLARFASLTEDTEEVFENREHIAISKFYEKKPKPALVAAQEFLADQLTYRYAEEKAEA